MKDKKAAIMDKVHPDLLVPPHIVDKLFQLVAGEWRPDPAQQEQLAAAQEYEQMGAYAEAIVAKGREEADKHFPVLADHIKRCPGCKSTLEAILAFLNE